jgi:hypothetical protein
MGIHRLAANNPATVVVGRHQFAYLYQGNGQRPLRIDLTNGTVSPSGIDAPENEPKIAIGTTPLYYVARADVGNRGTQYTLPPTITFPGDCERPAVARCFLEGDGIGSVTVIDGGRGYKAPPTSSLGGTSGTGAVLEAVLGDASTANTGISAGSLVRNADYSPCLLPVNYDGLPVNGLSPLPNWSVTDSRGNVWKFVRKVGSALTYSVEIRQSFGSTPTTFTTPALAEITFATTVVIDSLTYPISLSNAGIKIVRPGEGYSPTPVVIEVPGAGRPTVADGKPVYTSCGSPGTQPLVLEFRVDAGEATTDRPISRVNVVSGGSGYTGSPRIAVAQNYGSGASLRAITSGGAITSVEVVQGGAYSEPPELALDSGGAAVIPIARAHLRGLYQCCYRYVDDTPPERGGPICSSISPIAEVDCGDGAGSITWVVDPPPVVPGRTLKLELWRSTGDQAYQLYRLPDSAITKDDFTDAELQNPNREGYLSMPILLPNGELNAGRFGVPPSDKAVACMFQDRLWVAGDTSGKQPNTLYYSEVDEPESIPEVNDLVLQTNVKGHDHITALIPYGGSLGVMQTHHAYRLSYVAQPLIDANLQLAAFRGCVNQRCWDEYEGVIYAMDSDGVYAMDQGGQVKSISEPIADLFMSKIDFTDPRWFSVVADKNLNVLRVSVRLVGDEPGPYPTRQFVYSFIANGWWEERYPNPLVGGCNLNDATGYYRCFFGGADGTMYGVAYGNADSAYKTIHKVTLADAGTGYTMPPKVRVTGGAGAEIVTAVRGDGSLLGIYIRCGGYGYENPTITIDPPPEGRTATATCETFTGPVPIPCWYKSGNMEYPSDSLAPGGKVDQNRSVSVLFTPTQGPTPLKLLMYYNNAAFPRGNVVQRDRGDGAVYNDHEPTVSIDMDAGLLPPDISSGVCRAIFTGHTMDDIRGNDRHVAVELAVARTSSGKATIHQLDVYGVPNPNGGG